MKRNSLSPLWHNRDFLSFWVGQAVSEIGSRITREGLPLAAVITLGITPMTMGWLQVVTAIPVMLLGLIVGAVLDRFPRRPFLIGTDILRFACLMVIPVAAITGTLGLTLLFVISAIMGLLTLIFRVAYQSYLPTLVGRDFLVDGNTKLSVTQSFAEVVGPGLAGTLVQLLTAPIAILLDAFTYLVSALCIWRIRTPERAHSRSEDRTPLRHDIVHGLRAIGSNHILLALAATAATSALFSGIVFTMDVLYAIRTLKMSAMVFGFTVMFGGVGALIGAAACQPLVRRFGFGPVLLTAAFLEGLFGWFIPLAHGPVWVAAGFLIGWQLLGDLCGVIFGILASSLRQSVTADHLLGRVNASINLLTSVLGPIGALLGGWIATAFSLRVAMAIGVGGITVAAFWLFLAPVVKLKTLPSVEQLKS